MSDFPHHIHTSLSLALALCIHLALGDPLQAQDSAPKSPEFSFQVERVKAKSLGGRRARYGVFLPKGYNDKVNAQKSYPWVIWLHGMRGSLYKFRDNGGDVFNAMRKSGKIPAMILVTPSAGSMPLYMNGGAQGDLEDAVLKDIWSDVEKKFRISKHRHETAIMGVSMGALGAMKMALRFPEKFGSVAVHSGPVLPLDPAEMSGRFKRYGEFMQIDRVFGSPIDKKKWATEIPMAIIEAKPAKAFEGLRIYMDAGSADRYKFGEPNQEFSKALTAKGIKHTFRFIKGGGHSWGAGAVQSAMLVSFPFVAEGFKSPPKKTPAPEKK
jgi:S-formylglutathione hydrolase FrmB